MTIELLHTPKEKRGYTLANHPNHIQNSIVKHQHEIESVEVVVKDHDAYHLAVAATLLSFIKGCNIPGEIGG